VPTINIPIHARGPAYAPGAATWLAVGAFNDSQLAQAGRVPIANFKLAIGKTGGGVRSLQVMYGKAWAPQRGGGGGGGGDVAYAFFPNLDGAKEFISEAYVNPGAGSLLADVLFRTNQGRSIGGISVKPGGSLQQLQPMHPCPSLPPGSFRLAYVSGNVATSAKDVAKTSASLFSLSFYWIDATAALPVSGMWQWHGGSGMPACGVLHARVASTRSSCRPSVLSDFSPCLERRRAAPWSRS
jgi:hypothetical protein